MHGCYWSKCLHKTMFTNSNSAKSVSSWKEQSKKLNLTQLNGIGPCLLQVDLDYWNYLEYKLFIQSLRSSLSPHHLLFCFLLLSYLTTRWESVFLSDRSLRYCSQWAVATRRRRRAFCICIVSECSTSVALPCSWLPVWSRATGSHRPQSASASGGHFGSLSVRDHRTLQLHMHSPILLW